MGTQCPNNNESIHLFLNLQVSKVNKGKKYVILYAGRYFRGFHRHILSDPPQGLVYKTLPSKQKSHFFEVKPWHADILARLWHSRIGDWLGLIQEWRISKYFQKDVDGIQTFNRFAKTKVPYVIYLENPTALFHYEPNRIQSRLGIHRIKTLCQNPQLKAIVCMSQICKDTLDKVIPFIPKEVKRTYIYPYVPANPNVSPGIIEQRCKSKLFKCLYISSDFELKGGKEIIEAIKELTKSGVHNVYLTIVTKRNSISRPTREEIENHLKNVTLLDFNQPYSVLQALYASSHVLLHPSLKDSFGMVVLEAIKSGLPVIATRVYAIPEMIHNGINGFLMDPSVWYFTPNGFPNMTIWENKRAFINRAADERVVQFLTRKINLLNQNRKLLLTMALSSWKVATQGPFSRETIHKLWFNLFDEIIKQ